LLEMLSEVQNCCWCLFVEVYCVIESVNFT